MALTTIGVGGLSALEKAQMTSNIAKSQKNSLMAGLAGGDSPIDSGLMYQIYDQKALSPRVLAAVAAKQKAADEKSAAETAAAETEKPASTDTQATSAAPKRNYATLNDELITQNRAATTSEVPEKRPDPVVSGIKNVDLTA